MLNTLRENWHIFIIGTLFSILVLVAGCQAIDIAYLKFRLTPKIVKIERKTQKSSSPKITYDAKVRSKKINALRSRYYYTVARADYYKGDYKEALERLERAKRHNPNDYGVFRLCGQIYFELRNYRKAFDNWSRASELANEDREISRDVQVIKKVIRYSNREIDRLKVHVHKNPADRVSLAKLQELEDQVK